MTFLLAFLVPLQVVSAVKLGAGGQSLASGTLVDCHFPKYPTSGNSLCRWVSLFSISPGSWVFANAKLIIWILFVHFVFSTDYCSGLFYANFVRYNTICFLLINIFFCFVFYYFYSSFFGSVLPHLSIYVLSHLVCRVWELRPYFGDHRPSIKTSLGSLFGTWFLLIDVFIFLASISTSHIFFWFPGITLVV